MVINTSFLFYSSTILFINLNVFNKCSTKCFVKLVTVEMFFVRNWLDLILSLNEDYE